LPTHSPVKIAIAGFGAIGRQVAYLIDQGVPGLELAAVSAKDLKRAESHLATFAKPVPVVPLSALEPYADMVIECAPPFLFRDIAEPFLRKGKDVMALSTCALLAHSQLIDIAKANNCQIVIPTGAILGLDAVTAAAEGEIRQVRLTTRKPPIALAKSAYFLEHGIDPQSIKEAVRVFSGTPRDAARDFPTNVNVAVTLGLAGLGLDKTTMEIWADPGVQRNTHSVEVVSDAAIFSMKIENMPSENPSTSKIAALSVVAYLRKMRAPLRIGS
jgi:aspartate dehydrogenase